MAQLSDDCFAHGGKLMTVEEALARLRASSTTVTEAERRPLRAALGRILREDIVASTDVPPHPNSAVDGYAVFFDDLEPNADTVLPIDGRATAGHPLDRPAERGKAVRIFTGAELPAGPDTVMMQEDCRIEDRCVVIRPGIKRGANTRRRAEDIAAGTTILAAGQRLRAQDLGQAAAVGRGELMVSRPLSAALFSTGDELRDPGQPLAAGCIYDSNRYIVAALLRGLGCEVADLGILRDRRDVIMAALNDAAASHDVIVTSGGVSVGDEDHVKQAVESLGALHMWRLAIKPGRPIALGQVGHVPFVGLPGNPVAVMVTFLNVVRPLILRLMGGTDLEPHHFQVRALFDHKKKKDRREWVRVRLVRGEDGGLAATKFPRDGAGILSSMVDSDGLVELPEEMTHLEAGSLVDFLPFSEVTP